MPAGHTGASSAERPSGIYPENYHIKETPGDQTKDKKENSRRDIENKGLENHNHKNKPNLIAIFSDWINRPGRNRIHQFGRARHIHAPRSVWRQFQTDRRRPSIGG